MVGVGPLNEANTGHASEDVQEAKPVGIREAGRIRRSDVTFNNRKDYVVKIERGISCVVGIRGSFGAWGGRRILIMEFICVGRWWPVFNCLCRSVRVRAVLLCVHFMVVGGWVKLMP